MIQLETQYSVYQGVRGKSLLKREVAEWEQKRFYEFIEFAKLFIDGDGLEAKIAVTKIKVRAAEKKYLPIEYHPFQEFLYRIDVMSTSPDFDDVKFMRKLNMMMMMVFKYIKEHPHLIDDEIRLLVGDNSKLNWCLNLVKIKESRIGPMVVSDNTDGDNNKVTNVTPEMLMLQSLANVSSLINEISGSFTKTEISKMKTNDKFSAISKLSFVYNVGRNMKPNANIFKQINIINAKPEDLEKTLLESATGNNE